MKHTKQCQERAVALAAWKERWPNHCSKCLGRGSIAYSDDPSPAGVSLAPGAMEYSDPCFCVEEGTCPRCGQRTGDPLGDAFVGDGETPCPHCGWLDGNQPGEAAPEYECWCEDLGVPQAPTDIPF